MGGAFTLPQGSPGSTGSFVAFGQWPLLGAVVIALGALCKLGHMVFKNEHPDVVAARLSLEQVASAFFVGLVLREARRVFSIVDDHLPLALSQANSPNPGLSRFDSFCQSLRAIPAEELNDPDPEAPSPRGKYANVIKESFGRMISDSAERLIDAMMAAGGTPSNAILNPTAARFSLEGDGFLSFAVVADFDYRNRRLETRFQRIWTVVGVFAVLGIVAAFGVVSGVVINKEWAQELAWYSLFVGTCSGVLALSALSLCYLVKRSLIRRSQKYGDPSAVNEFVKAKRAKDGRTGN